MAAYYSVFALVIYSLQGAAAYDAYGLTLGKILLLYWAGGLVGGFMVGLLMPITRSRIGAALVGAVAAFPVFAGISLSIYGSEMEWGVVIICAVVLGGIGGVAMASTGGPTWDELNDMEEGLWTDDARSAPVRDDPPRTD